MASNYNIKILVMGVQDALNCPIPINYDYNCHRVSFLFLFVSICSIIFLCIL